MNSLQSQTVLFTAMATEFSALVREQNRPGAGITGAVYREWQLFLDRLPTLTDEQARSEIEAWSAAQSLQILNMFGTDIALADSQTEKLLKRFYSLAAMRFVRAAGEWSEQTEQHHATVCREFFMKHVDRTGISDEELFQWFGQLFYEPSRHYTLEGFIAGNCSKSTVTELSPEAKAKNQAIRDRRRQA